MFTYISNGIMIQYSGGSSVNRCFRRGKSDLKTVLESL